MNVVSVMLVLLLLGVLWPLRRIVWFPVAVAAVALLANL